MSEIYGLIDGCYTCNHERLDEINKRISDRNIPSQELQPQYSMRSVSTKYACMPILDQLVKPTVSMREYKSYSVSNTFNPGNAQAPWSGFSQNVGVESDLRNQNFALQRCNQSTYVPSSSSDLYNVVVDSRNIQQTHPLLFDKPEFSSFNPNEINIGNNMLHNHTRNQIQDLHM